MFRGVHNRRRFLQNAALFSGGLAASLLNAPRLKASDEFIEAIVIGSGFGGSVAALRLGQAGINTLVLERGRRWPITSSQNTFATFRNPDGRSAWLSSTTFDGVPVDVYTGILEYKQENGIGILCGAGVGGSSLVYNAVTYQPSRELFYQSFPRTIDYDEMDSVYYPRVNSILKALPIPQDILSTDYYLASQLFLEQAQAAGLPNRLIEIAVHWDVIRQELEGTKVPSAILGEHWYGLNSGAKNSLDRNYLVRAENTGYVNILPLHLVTEISEVDGTGYRISCTQINESGEIIARKNFSCKYLFLAAGSMGTSALLVKARATGTLPKLNRFVGKNWGSNGDILAFRKGLGRPTNPQLGGPSCAIAEHFDNPISPISLVSIPQFDAPKESIPALSMGIPSVRGTFSYDSSIGSVKLAYPYDQKLSQATQLTYNLLNKKNPLSSASQKFPTTELPSNLVTAHPLGGATMGQVCDSYGRVNRYKSLYVVDGALIPGSTGCANPSFTIAALAERSMERIIAEDFN